MTLKGYGLIGTFCEPPFPFSSPHGLKMSPNILEKLNFQGTNWHGIDPSLWLLAFFPKKIRMKIFSNFSHFLMRNWKPRKTICLLRNFEKSSEMARIWRGKNIIYSHTKYYSNTTFKVMSWWQLTLRWNL